MGYENLVGGEKSGTGTGNQRTQREGPIARGIEKQTAKIPSDVFLWVGLASIGTSLVLQLAGKKQASTFVANWVPTVLVLGLYNKLVKIAGHDQQNQTLD